jgi:peroxiredoxin
MYSTVGHDLPKTNGNGRWALPVPATYVIDCNGIIQYASVDADYRNRAEPKDVLANIGKLIN